MNKASGGDGIPVELFKISKPFPADLPHPGLQVDSLPAGLPGKPLGTLLEEVAINPTIELPEVIQTLGGHKQSLWCTRTQEKGAVTPQETEPDLTASLGVSGTGLGPQWSAMGHSCKASCTLGSLDSIFKARRF